MTVKHTAGGTVAVAEAGLVRVRSKTVAVPFHHEGNSVITAAGCGGSGIGHRAETIDDQDRAGGICDRSDLTVFEFTLGKSLITGTAGIGIVALGTPVVCAKRGGLLFGGQIQTMLPKLRSTNHPGMELIRPLYLIREEEIEHWRDYNGLRFLQCACRFTEEAHLDPSGSKRLETKRLIRALRVENPQVEYNLFHAMEHINLGTCLGWKDRDGLHSFLDEY